MMPEDTMPSSNKLLLDTLRRKVPVANLRQLSLPQAPKISLNLIEEDYPQHQLSPDEVENLMDNPPYWAFCWASGQVMARYLLDHPCLLKDKTVVDFGAGSGVVAIAAKMAGAKRAIAVDNDSTALLACRENAQLNKQSIEVSSSLELSAAEKNQSLLLVADVFYDEENIPLLQQFLADFEDVIVADSRVKPHKLAGLVEVSRHEGSTVPDLGETADFNSVGIYRTLDKAPRQNQ